MTLEIKYDRASKFYEPGVITLLNLLYSRKK
jgi:hypothetical protein